MQHLNVLIQHDLLKSFLAILLLTGFAILLVLSINTGCTKNKEPWTNYVSIPFGNVSTPYDNPIGLYARPEYRLPYNWPVGIKRDFPILHIAPLTPGI